MRRNIITLVIVVICLMLTGACSSVPKDAIMLTSTVTDGIKRMQIENENAIKTLADIQRNILDEKYEEIYASTEIEYMKEAGIAIDKPLSKDEQMDIAANVIAERDEILKQIETKEKSLLAQSRANSEKVIEINEHVKNYLKSLSDLNEANEKIKKLLQDITGVDLNDITSVVKNKVRSSL